MVLNKRERTIFWAAVAAIVILALDRFAVTPLLNRYDETQRERTRLLGELTRARALLGHRREMSSRWREMLDTGMETDPAEAESQILHALRDFSEDAGVSLSLLKPDRLTQPSRLPEIAVQASGTGSLSAISRLLFRIQTASIPIKITETHISARKEGVDDLTLQLRVSTIHLPDESAPTPDQGGEL